ncbi:HSP20 family protein [Pullulanibacillus pueri]|uniref:Hsp20/alpha crystallin family protein n=1 Tax=Pullulanibacillus pueri TaxID=1437324 RepID=A0A8J2ZQY4_9BACL|nr:Hsp20/alpha crystallin family protein [Pullulanibacillus pueri]MBM7680021.1 HSP20 family protein [Pullulanibacillus pueri]GGH73976.1 hypothetical protein GCM10007096_01750 [Pullulanibacillus pueri]
MDVDKLKKWLDVAQQFQGNDFWSEIFDDNTTSFSQNQKQKKGYTAKQEMAEQPKPPQPAIDLFQTPNEFIILIDLPGIAKEDVQLTLTGNKVTIQGTARLNYSAETLIHSERLNGSFERSIDLPDAVDSQRAMAQFHQGILHIRLPRAEPNRHSISID